MPSSISADDGVEVGLETHRHLHPHRQWVHDKLWNHHGYIEKFEKAKAHRHAVIEMMRSDRLSSNSHLWSKHRVWLHSFVEGHGVETLLGIIVLYHLAVTICQTDHEANGRELPNWIQTSSTVILAVYVVELAARLYIYRLAFFKSKWHWLDLAVVTVDTINFGLDSDRSKMTVFRIIRTLRIARAARLLQFFPEAFIIAHGILGVIRIIIWCAVLVGVMLTLWSIIAVDLIHPLTEHVFDPGHECRSAFASVFNALLTFLQGVVAQDAFGMCTTPVMQRYPWTAPYFYCVLISAGLGIMNVALSAVVDRAAELRADNSHLLILSQLHTFEGAAKVLHEICETELDKDSSGHITLSTLHVAHDTNHKFAEAMRTLGLGKGEITTVFHTMDEDRTGAVPHHDFVEHLHKVKTEDWHFLMIIMRQYLNSIKHKLADEFVLMKEEQAELKRIVRTVNHIEFDKTVDDRRAQHRTAKPVLNRTNSMPASIEDFDHALQKNPRHSIVSFGSPSQGREDQRASSTTTSRWVTLPDRRSADLTQWVEQTRHWSHVVHDMKELRNDKETNGKIKDHSPDNVLPGIAERGMRTESTDMPAVGVIRKQSIEKDQIFHSSCAQISDRSLFPVLGRTPMRSSRSTKPALSL